MYLKTQYDMGLRLQVKFQTEVLPIIQNYRNLIHKLAHSLTAFYFNPNGHFNLFPVSLVPVAVFSDILSAPVRIAQNV